MKIVLTEFDKAILLGMFIVTKGSSKKGVKEKEIIRKFPIRQKRHVTYSLKKLVSLKFLKKKEDRYYLLKRGVKEAKKLIVTGAPIWGVSSRKT